MKLATATKIRIARCLYSCVQGARTLAGKRDPVVRCSRGGVQWELDLREGIDLAIYTFGRFEPATCKALERLIEPGSIVFDIGANIGAHTLPLAKLVGPTGRVVAVEPTDWAFQKLSKNVSLNPELAERITLVNAAVIAEGNDAPKQFYSSWNLIEDGDATKFHPVLGGFLQSAENARAVTLDSLVEETGLSPTFIKVDVDGFEVDVFSGAGAVLTNARPKILLELCPYLHEERGHEFRDLITILTEKKYRFLDERGKALPSDADELNRLIPHGGGINSLVVPAA